MSIRKLETSVVSCDSCDEVFADFVPMTSGGIECLAIKHGWGFADEGSVTHRCPECKERLALAEAVDAEPEVEITDPMLPVDEGELAAAWDEDMVAEFQSRR